MVVKIEHSLQKEQIAASILHALPEWFGLPESTKRYIKESKELHFWAYMKGEEMHL